MLWTVTSRPHFASCSPVLTRYSHKADSEWLSAADETAELYCCSLSPLPLWLTTTQFREAYWQNSKQQKGVEGFLVTRLALGNHSPQAQCKWGGRTKAAPISVEYGCGGRADSPHLPINVALDGFHIRNLANTPTGGISRKDHNSHLPLSHADCMRKELLRALTLRKQRDVKISERTQRPASSWALVPARKAGTLLHFAFAAMKPQYGMHLQQHTLLASPLQICFYSSDFPHGNPRRAIIMQYFQHQIGED